ncbi:TatD family hydrolase [Treponema endosymbiont of Eucomonympha sp.]|uniref:TatD family hydrolase n=1 Tax=Treponema endosymbiont of Eucomonympha sp. TaxID=1580831 RepID=UPI000AC46CFB|nr:TatD family hydrolase [Treponema endosymbiont of Eucomonympha sp.]
MFSDTHFHLRHIAERGVDCSAVLGALAVRDCRFALDVGTESGDLSERLAFAENLVAGFVDDAAREKLRRMLRFSAGIWPSAEAISRRAEAVAELNACLSAHGRNRAVCALGECGLDRCRNPDANGSALIQGEAELFESQLVLARARSLPVIVHSRDAFGGTLSCIANAAHDFGVIHCFSYGIAEARRFLDRGWHISLSGSITYAKKAQLADVAALIAFIPRDRLLLETDAPYLAPVPFRGQANAPELAEHVYRFAAARLGVPAEELSAQVDANADALFGIRRQPDDRVSSKNSDTTRAHGQGT